MTGQSQKVHGFHAVGSLLQREPGRISALHVDAARQDRRMQELLELARRAGVQVHLHDHDAIARLAAAAAHQGVVAELRESQALDESALFRMLEELRTPALLVLLDGVTDPHNLGACLRSAAAFGAQALIVPRDNSAPLNSTARKVASGGAELVPLVCVTNLARCMRRLRDAGIWLVGADGGAEAGIAEIDLRVPTALVLGAEGSGMRRLTREHCDFLARIPMNPALESLNVSVAAGILLYEAWRQRSISQTPGG